MNIIKNTINFFLKRRKLFLFVFLFCITSFSVASSARAGWLPVDVVMNVITFLMHAVIYSLGYLAAGLIWVVVYVAKVNNFINVPAVNYGWVIVRDLCNMFFILIFLLF